jgi:hypothetical protein
VGALLIRIFDGLAAFSQDPAGPFRGAFLVMAALMLASTVDSLFLPRHAGAEVSRPGMNKPATDQPVSNQPVPNGPAVSRPGPGPAEEQPPPRPAEERGPRP